MSQWTRRAVLRSGILASAVGVVGGVAKASEATDESASLATDAWLLTSRDIDTPVAAHRSRESLDMGWRFSLGHASDPAKDFGYAAMGRNRPFAKAGEISKVTSARFDDSAWRKVNLPHDWAVELPFNSTYPLPEQGGRPLGREFPETSIGWYRKSFTLDADDAGKRIWLEFDGMMRSAEIFTNGHYLTHHLSGYAPLRCHRLDELCKPSGGQRSEAQHWSEPTRRPLRCDAWRKLVLRRRGHLSPRMAQQAAEATSRRRWKLGLQQAEEWGNGTLLRRRDCQRDRHAAERAYFVGAHRSGRQSGSRPNLRASRHPGMVDLIHASEGPHRRTKTLELRRPALLHTPHSPYRSRSDHGHN